MADRAGKGIALHTAVRAGKVDDPRTAGRDRKEIGRLTADRGAKVASPSIARGGKATGRSSNVPARKGADHSTARGLRVIARRSSAPGRKEAGHSTARGLEAVVLHSTDLDLMGTGLRTRAATVGSPSTARGAMIDHRAMIDHKEPIARGRTDRGPSVRPGTGRGRTAHATTTVTVVRRSTGHEDRGRLAEEIGRAATSAVRQASTPRVHSALPPSIREI